MIDGIVRLGVSYNFKSNKLFKLVYLFMYIFIHFRTINFSVNIGDFFTRNGDDIYSEPKM